MATDTVSPLRQRMIEDMNCALPIETVWSCIRSRWTVFSVRG
jgi:hypothetical protein